MQTEGRKTEKNGRAADYETQKCNIYTQSQLHSSTGSANLTRYSNLAQNSSPFVASSFEAVMKMHMWQKGKSQSVVYSWKLLPPQKRGWEAGSWGCLTQRRETINFTSVFMSQHRNMIRNQFGFVSRSRYRFLWLIFSTDDQQHSESGEGPISLLSALSQDAPLWIACSRQMCAVMTTSWSRGFQRQHNGKITAS